MTEFTVTAAGWSVDAAGSWLKLKTEYDGQAQRTAAEMEAGQKYTVTIKKYRQKRSLDANAYLWTLINKLSVKLNLPPKELYQHYIPDVGDNSDVVCIKTEAVKKFCEMWEHNGPGWCTDILSSKIDGCTNVVCYYGSSTYDTAQMARLIDKVVNDCKSLGIETLTPDELARMGIYESGNKGNENPRGG